MGKLGKGNSVNRKSRGGGIDLIPTKARYAVEPDPTGSSWSSDISYEKDTLPIMVNVLQKYTTDDSGNRVLHPDSGNVNKKFIEEVISVLSQMLKGTYRNRKGGELVGGLTPVLDNENHGESAYAGAGLTPFIPANLFKYWLYRFNNPVKNPTDTKGGYKTKISFDVTNITTGGNSAHQTEYNTARANLLSAQTTANNAHTAHGGQDLEDIANYGGLLKTDGIFFWDIEEYYDPAVFRAKRTTIDGSNPGLSDSEDPFHDLFKEMQYDHDQEKEWITSAENFSNGFPGVTLWMIDGVLQQEVGWLGRANFPATSGNGNIWVQASFPELANPMHDDYENTKEKFASTLLHEVGHMLGLRHAYEGGSLMQYAPHMTESGFVETIQPTVQMPALNAEVSAPTSYSNSNQNAIYETNTTKDVERFNKLDHEKKSFMEYFYRAYLPSFTRGVFHDELIDSSKDFSSHIRLPRVKTKDANNNDVVVKSINTAVNSIKYFDWSIAGITGWDNIIDKYGPAGFHALTERLKMGLDAHQDLPFWWTGSVHDSDYAVNCGPTYGYSVSPNAQDGFVANSDTGSDDLTGLFMTSGLPNGAAGGLDCGANTAGSITDFAWPQDGYLVDSSRWSSLCVFPRDLFPYSQTSGSESDVMSLSFWVKFDTVNVNQILICKNGGTYHNTANLFMVGLIKDVTDSNKYKLTAFLRDNSAPAEFDTGFMGGDSAESRMFISSNDKLGRVTMGSEWTSTDWNHVVLTFEPVTHDGNPDTKVHMYLNGTDVESNGYLFGDDDTPNSSGATPARYRRISQMGHTIDNSFTGAYNHSDDFGRDMNNWLVGVRPVKMVDCSVLDDDCDGDEGATDPSGQTITNTHTGKVRFGNRFDGKFTEFGMFTKTLTSAEVTAIWNSGTPIDLRAGSPCSPSIGSVTNYTSSGALANCHAYYKFDEKTAITDGWDERRVRDYKPHSWTNNTNVYGGGKQLVINKTDANGHLLVEAKTRIPFCIPNEDGTPSNDYDEFWMYNMNWLNPAYPPYPPNWPTDKIYDATDNLGNPLCPCLYAEQTYSKTWVPNTGITPGDIRTNLGEDANGNRVIKPGATVGMNDTTITSTKRDNIKLMWEFLFERDDKDYKYEDLDVGNCKWTHPAYNPYDWDYSFMCNYNSGYWTADTAEVIGFDGRMNQVFGFNGNTIYGWEFFANLSRSTDILDSSWWLPFWGANDYYSSVFQAGCYWFEMSAAYFGGTPGPHMGITQDLDEDGVYDERISNVYANHFIAPFAGGTGVQNNNYREIMLVGDPEWSEFFPYENFLPTSTLRNGYMPDFGVYGFGPRTCPPSDYVSNMSSTVLERTTGPEGVAEMIFDTNTDDIRFLSWGANYDQQFMPYVVKFFTGSLNPGDGFNYNPYKVDVSKMGYKTAADWYGIDNNVPVGPYTSAFDIAQSYNPRVMGQAINYHNPPLGPISTRILSDTYERKPNHPYTNPLNGKLYKGNPVGPDQLLNAMNYNRMVPIPEYEGRYITGHWYLHDIIQSQRAQIPGLTTNPLAAGVSLADYPSDAYQTIHRWGYSGMSAFSKSQLLRMRRVMEQERGKTKGMLDFGRLMHKYLTDLNVDYSHDANEIKTALEKYFGTS